MLFYIHTKKKTVHVGWSDKQRHKNLYILEIHVSLWQTLGFPVVCVGFLCSDYQVVINLHHDEVLLSRRETKGATFTEWNSSFLFDLPPGDVSQLPLMFEFIILQARMSWLWITSSFSLLPCAESSRFALSWDRTRDSETAKFSAALSSVRRLQMQDELTGGTCAGCRWSRRAGTLFSQSLHRQTVETSWTPRMSWRISVPNQCNVYTRVQKCCRVAEHEESKWPYYIVFHFTFYVVLSSKLFFFKEHDR